MFFISAPSRAPDFVIAQTSNSTSLVVKWSHLPKEYFQGKPIGYYIAYYPADLESDTNFMNVNFALNYTVLSNLTAYTIYVINVSAVSSGGKGPAKTTWVRTQAEGKIQVETIEFLLPYNISSDTYNNQKTLF